MHLFVQIKGHEVIIHILDQPNSIERCSLCLGSVVFAVHTISCIVICSTDLHLVDVECICRGVAHCVGIRASRPLGEGPVVTRVSLVQHDCCFVRISRALEFLFRRTGEDGVFVGLGNMAVGCSALPALKGDVVCLLWRALCGLLLIVGLPASLCSVIRRTCGGGCVVERFRSSNVFFWPGAIKKLGCLCVALS